MKRITYRHMHEVNRGTENEPELHQVFNTVTIECGEDTFESNYAAAQRHSCDGEIAVEDIPDEETEPTTDERVAALEEENALLKAQISAQSDQMDFYENCIVEMAMVVYA